MDSVTYCISKDMLPIYTVEKEGFCCLIDTLDSRYEMPSAKYFSSLAIPSLYEKTRERVATEIKSAKHLKNIGISCIRKRAMICHIFFMWLSNFLFKD